MKQLMKVFGLLLMTIAVLSCEQEDPQPKESDLIDIKLSTAVPDPVISPEKGSVQQQN